MKLCKRASGQALIEMALVFPFFLLIIIGGIIDFGFAFFNLLTLQQMANEAAQYGAEWKENDAPVTDQMIRDLIDSRKPLWWVNQVFTDISRTVTSDAGAAPVVIVHLRFTSPVYTPFYRTMITAFGQYHGLRLSVVAAFQVPQRNT